MLLQEELEETPIIERIKRVAPFWEGLSQDERVELMTFSVKEVKAQAVLIARKMDKEAYGDALLILEATQH